MGKVFVFEVNEENGSTMRKVFSSKPSIEDLIDCCCDYEKQSELREALEEVIQRGSALFDDGAVNFELSSIDFVDNQGLQTFKGEGVRLITQFRYDDRVVAMSEDDFYDFMCKLSNEEECEVFFKDDEEGFKFNHLEVKSFLRFYERHKKEENQKFNDNEKAMIERIYTLITDEKPSYIKNSGYVRFM